MTNMVMYDTVDELLKLTGLPDSDALWDAGFDLDDWDVGFQTDSEIPDGWLLCQMDYSYCVGRMQKVQYKNKFYHMVYHA